MPLPMAKSSIRSVASLCSRAAKLGTRSFSSAARYDEAYEAEKWEKISIAGIVTCAVLSIYNLSKGHHEHPEPPPYPYLRIQKKDFPWVLNIPHSLLIKIPDSVASTSENIDIIIVGPEPLTEHIKKKSSKQ